MLTERWTKLERHKEQQRLWTSRSRFRVVAAGRRSGKTELAKRNLIRRACSYTKYVNGRFIFAAPTRDQAKKIYWDDVKLMVPHNLRRGDPSESELAVTLWNGARIEVTGLDVPARVEGPPLDGIVLDEYADMKKSAWPNHVRPALSTKGRLGWAWFIGVPNGRNHFYDTFSRARSNGKEWDAFHWISADILDAQEIEDAKKELDPRSYRREYEAGFDNFEGRAYYDFTAEAHAAKTLPYDPEGNLVFMFDFNVSPGVAAIGQEHVIDGKSTTCIIGEVWIRDNSNTPLVCRKLIADWGKHKGKIMCFGDSTGGNRGSAKVQGNDWELIRAELQPVFKDRLGFNVPSKNGPEKVRVNSVNSRLKNTAGDVRLLVDPRCLKVVQDFEGVTVLEGSDGAIDKESDKSITHITDAIGYYVVRIFPLGGVTSVSQF